MSQVHNHDYDPSCGEYVEANGDLKGECLGSGGVKIFCRESFNKALEEVEELAYGTPESPDHYTRLKALTGVETWDILDFVAGDDPDMWNMGKYWFRMGHKEGQSTLTEKKKMLKYLERSIEKEETAE